jgi:hypothetical protein
MLAPEHGFLGQAPSFIFHTIYVHSGRLDVAFLAG